MPEHRLNYTLQASPDLKNWREVAGPTSYETTNNPVLGDIFNAYTFETDGTNACEFYRAGTIEDRNKSIGKSRLEAVTTDGLKVGKKPVFANDLKLLSN